MPGCYPRRFHDDGTAVTLDLHGCTVDDALALLRRTVQAAHRRGRSQVVVIHGQSSSEAAGPVRTIKTELRRGLEDGAYAAWVTGPRWSDDGGRCTLWLHVGARPDRTLLKVTDVVRP